ncbi:MAG: hypothetical protein ACC657_07650 [Thiohalomonadales bacterium]
MNSKDIIDEQSLLQNLDAEFKQDLGNLNVFKNDFAINEIQDMPLDLEASGLYVNKMQANKEQFRLDIDGLYPQMQASGTIFNGLTNRINWIARLTAQGKNRLLGNIWFKDGNTADFPFTSLVITIMRSRFMNQRMIWVQYTGGAVPTRNRVYRYQSNYFHSVEFEFDRVADLASADMVTAIDTCAHPNRSTTMPCENLSIKTVFQRAGFNVTQSQGNGVIPIDQAGTNSTWSNTEMHDAMQTYWSRFADKPQWSMWVLFANLHDQLNGLGGIMFDDIGPNHRQGTAIFENAFISNAPAGDANPAAWVARMRHWTACHEMGHAFNLAHSWQKELNFGSPWTPLTNESEARSFMNYPDNVTGREAAFFADFENRFSDNELLFMRHAPDRFVQMGNANWFDNHGFEQANILESNQLNLQLRLNRPEARYEFLEPVILEMKLTNSSTEPLVIDKNILMESNEMTVIIKKDGKPARQWKPFVRYLQKIEKVVLYPGESLYESLYVSVGVNGWDISEPGQYVVQMLMNNGSDIVSNPVSLRVLPAQSYDAECCAQDIFSEDVGRILSMNGSRVLSSGNDALQELIKRMPSSKAAQHAHIALAMPQTRDYKMLSEKNGEIQINTLMAKVDETKSTLNSALLTNSDSVAQTLGHISYKRLMDDSANFLKQKGDDNAAQEYTELCYKTLSARGVPDWVFKEQATVKTAEKSSKPKRKKKSEEMA